MAALLQQRHPRFPANSSSGGRLTGHRLPQQTRIALIDVDDESESGGSRLPRQESTIADIPTDGRFTGWHRSIILRRRAHSAPRSMGHGAGDLHRRQCWLCGQPPGGRRVVGLRGKTGHGFMFVAMTNTTNANTATPASAINQMWPREMYLTATPRERNSSIQP
jgi:hypothetical protein